MSTTTSLSLSLSLTLSLSLLLSAQILWPSSGGDMPDMMLLGRDGAKDVVPAAKSDATADEVYDGTG